MIFGKGPRVSGNRREPEGVAGSTLGAKIEEAGAGSW